MNSGSERNGRSSGAFCCSQPSLSILNGASKMAQQEKILSAKPSDPSSVSRTHIIEEQSESLKLPSDFHSDTMHTQFSERLLHTELFG